MDLRPHYQLASLISPHCPLWLYAFCFIIVCELNLCVSLLSGRSVSWSDHGVPTSPTTLLSQALLWTLQTSQPGTLPGRPGGRSICTRILTANTLEQVFVCYCGAHPLSDHCVIITFEPHVHHHPSLIIAAHEHHTSSHDMSSPPLASPWQHTHSRGQRVLIESAKRHFKAVAAWLLFYRNYTFLLI